MKSYNFNSENAMRRAPLSEISRGNSSIFRSSTQGVVGLGKSRF